MKRSLPQFLDHHFACAQAIRFANGKTPLQAWRQCKNPSWLLWVLTRTQRLKNRKMDFWALRFTAKYKKLLKALNKLANKVNKWSAIDEYQTLACELIRKAYPRPPARKKFCRP